MTKAERIPVRPGNEDYAREWVRRSTEWVLRAAPGSPSCAEQQRIDKVGAVLRAIRAEQRIPLATLAQELGCRPQLLCFLESGWGTREEYSSIVEDWASALGEDGVAYIQYLAKGIELRETHE